MQDIDPERGTYSTNLNYHKEGLDDPEVSFEFIAPPGFEITPTSYTGSLSSTIPLSISKVNSSILAGEYYFDFIIKMEGEIIFNESVPFRMKGFSDIRFEIADLTDPIILGEKL